MSTDKETIRGPERSQIEARVQILRERILREVRQCELEGRCTTVGRLITTFNCILGSAPVWWQLLKMRDDGQIVFEGGPHRILPEAKVRVVQGLSMPLAQTSGYSLMQ